MSDLDDITKKFVEDMATMDVEEEKLVKLGTEFETQLQEVAQLLATVQVNATTMGTDTAIKYWTSISKKLSEASTSAIAIAVVFIESDVDLD